jgi:Protein of unknown function (DUF992)
MNTMKKIILAVGFLAIAAPALADANVRLGTLTCRLTGVENDIVYTDQKFACSFEPSSGKVESYIGQIKEVGLDLSVTKDYTMTWYVVTAATNTYKPGDMAGTYVGASADVAAGSGYGADYLVGGFNNQLALQPWAGGEESGTGVSVGIESFELK